MGAAPRPTADSLWGEALIYLDVAIEELRATKMQPFLERALARKGCSMREREYNSVHF